jgi:tRNA U34 5-methylaminomethyl-2-thiouridine-forming methyltransferase MnmC
MSIEIITTEDGSHSIRNVEMNETYHSIHGAWQESTHVFIKNGLDFFANANSQEEIKILEVGFGTGLNALLALIHADKIDRKISFSTLEAFPLHENTWSQLNYGNDSPDIKRKFIALHKAAWGNNVAITTHFNLEKIETTLQNAFLSSDSYDLVFYDAFAPGKQPEMWELPLLEKVVMAMNKGSVFVTYCAKGQLKRNLRSLLLSVESPTGPPGKLQMVRATKP